MSAPKDKLLDADNSSGVNLKWQRSSNGLVIDDGSAICLVIQLENDREEAILAYSASFRRLY